MTFHLKYLLLLLVFTSVLILPLPVLGQSYTSTAGIRFGSNIGASFNQRILRKTTLEGIYESNLEQAGTAHLLLRQHSSILFRRVNLYAGAGPNLSWDETDTNLWGISGVLGVELTFFRLNVSFDYLPTYHQGEENTTPLKHSSALSVRYVLIKSDNKKFRQNKRSKKRQNKHKRKAQKGRSKLNFP